MSADDQPIPTESNVKLDLFLFYAHSINNGIDEKCIIKI